MAPLNLKLGSQIVLVGQDGKTTRTVTVVGFYTASLSLTVGGMISDNAVPVGLSNGHVLYAYSLILNPKQSTSVLNKVQAAVPNAETLNLAQISLLINGILNNLIIMLTAIASLAMIAGVIIIANAVALAMLERRRELGILKSVGHTSSSILGEVLIENGVIGFTGGLLAMLLVSVALLIIGTADQVSELWRQRRPDREHHSRHRGCLHGRGRAGGLERHPRPTAGGAALRVDNG